MEALHGAGVALVTPFNEDGSIDFDGLGALIEHQIKGGVDYLVSLGTTGETATLTEDEKHAVWQYTSERVAGRLPLVAGIGGNNTAEVAAQMRAFDHLGYIAILSVSPYYNKPTQEGIYQHYKALAEVSPLPIILYNVPGRTGSNMEIATTLRLAREFDSIVAIKEASANFDQFSRIMQDKPKDFLLISGDDPLTVPMMSLGAVGVISVVGNVFPEKVSRLTGYCLEGRFDEAGQIHKELIQMIALCFVEGNPAGAKCALKYMGICGDALRLPLTSVSEATDAAIKVNINR